MTVGPSYRVARPRDPDHYNGFAVDPSRDTIPLSRLAREPYRVLFPLAVVFGMTGIGHWLAYATGWSSDYSGFVHAGIQMQGYVTAFIAGFLMTAMPRFSSAPPATGAETSLVVVLLIAVWALLLSGRWVLAQSAFFATLVVLLVFVVWRVVRGRRDRAAGAARARPPVELVWVPIALVHGLAGAALVAGGQAGWLPSRALAVGRPMLQEGFVLAVVVGVGGFLAPRIMGTFRLARGGGAAAAAGRGAFTLHLAGGLLLLASFVVEGFGRRPLAYFLRAAVVTLFFLRSRTLAWKPAAREQFARYLWLSMWLVVVGLWAVALFPLYRVAALHLVFLGGYSLMTFAVGTMVILSHAGEAPRLRRPSWRLRLTAAGVLTALALRLAAVFYPERYFPLVGAAAFLWIAGAIAWLALVGPRLLRTIPVAEIEREHEEAKLRVLDQRGS